MRRNLVLLVIVLVAVSAVLAFQALSPERRGERAFARLGCTGCHFSGAGPTLTHVASKHDPKLLERFIQNPPEVYREREGQPLNSGYMLMPKLKVSPDEARWIVSYLKEMDMQ